MTTLNYHSNSDSRSEHLPSAHPARPSLTLSEHVKLLIKDVLVLQHRIPEITDVISLDIAQ